MENLKGKSMDLTEDNLNKLKELFPEVFEEGKIDFDKLRLILGDEVDDNEERYEFTWHGKNNAIRIAQTPSTGTLRPDKESSKNWDDTENLYIEGDNLEVLKLLQKSYFGKVKMIYIDPPYNTGKDFVYKDDFRDNIANYKEITNQTTKANPETNGRYHTDWLNMMYPRFKLARNLLREDGVIFISIDDNEYVNLKKICDEIFGEENCITNLIWKKKTGASDAVGIANITEDILIYIKDISYTSQVFTRNKNSYDLDRYKYNDKFSDKRGPYYLDTLDRGGLQYSDSLNYFIECPDGSKTYPNGRIEFINDGWIWKWSKQKVKWAIENGFLEFRKSTKKKSGWSVCYKNYLLVDNEGNVIDRSAPHKNIINNILNANAASDMKSIFGNNVFKYSKPKELIEKLLSFVKMQDEDIILDFFSGSATTAHAIINFNYLNNLRSKFIMVQLPELTNIAGEKIKYKNICEIGKERIRRAGDKIVSENKDKEGIENLDIGFKVFKLDSSNLKSWDSSIYNLEQNLLDMESNLKKDRTNEDLLYEILLKSGVELTAKIEEIKVGYNTLYNIGQGALLACLDDKITQDVIDEIPKHRSPFMDTKVIFKEAGFMSDAAKINAVQNLKQFKIEDVRSV